MYPIHIADGRDEVIDVTEAGPEACRASATWIAVILVHAWKDAPFMAIILSAGMQGIPEDLYDAARADGANAWQRFWGLTVLFAISTTRATLVVSYLAAYAFARIPFPGIGVLL